MSPEPNVTVFAELVVRTLPVVVPAACALPAAMMTLPVPLSTTLAVVKLPEPVVNCEIVPEPLDCVRVAPELAVNVAVELLPEPAVTLIPPEPAEVILLCNRTPVVPATVTVPTVPAVSLIAACSDTTVLELTFTTDVDPVVVKLSFKATPA